MGANYSLIDAGDGRVSLGRNLTYGVLDSLGRAIVTGHFDERAFPTEADLAKQYDVSRSVIREALRSCTALGLTVTRTGKGTFVVASKVANDLTLGQ